jgi:hypothetical protein
MLKVTGTFLKFLTVNLPDTEALWEEYWTILNTNAFYIYFVHFAFI